MRRLVHFLIILLTSAIWFSSCRSIRHIPVETVRTEIQYKNRLQRDSIHVHDSIYIRDNGDTIFVNRWHTEYKDRLLRDTCCVHRTDSIQVPYPVERELSWWQSVKLQVGEIAIGVIIGLIIIIVWLLRKNRKK